jgi:hypothetical protein
MVAGQPELETTTTTAQNRAELTDIHLLSAFEANYKPELQSIQDDVGAYQRAFNEPVNAHKALVDVWSLGAPEVNIGGHSVRVWVENQPDLYGRPREVLVIQNGYHPTQDIHQTTTFELIGAADDDKKPAVALRMTHEDIKSKGPYKMQTLLSRVNPDRFRQMVASVRSGTSK